MVGTGIEADTIKDNHMKNLEEAEQDLLAEQRSQKMLNLMSYRLDEETNDVRAEAGYIPS